MYWAYGIHVVDSIVNNPRRKIYEIVTSKEHLYDKYKTYGAKLISDVHVNKLFPGVQHQAIGAKIDPIMIYDMDFDFNGHIVMLDNIQDPHNAGSIIRSAAAFGINYAICTKDNASHESAGLLKSAAGNYEKINYICVTNLKNAITYFKNIGYWIAGMDYNERLSKPVSVLQEYKKIVLVVGSEHAGLRDITKKYCDFFVHIDMKNDVESLNASVAAAIGMYNLQ